MVEASDTRGDSRGLLPQASFDAKVVQGKDGWLFLDFDTNQVMKQQRGELLFTDEELEAWRSVLEGRAAWLASHDIPYHFLVPPNPQSAFPEKLPFEIPPGRVRPITQLIQHLAEFGCPVSLIYPLAELAECRTTPIYTQTNTHWTDWGA